MRDRRLTARNLISNLGGTRIETSSEDDDKKVVDVGEVDIVLQISDIHLGYEHSNVDAFHTFITEKVPEIDPDLLVVSGDLFEFWRSSIENVFIDHQQEIFELFSIAEGDTDVIVLAGNHDYRFITSDGPVEVADHVLFQSDGREFRVIHGQEYDAKNANNYTNEAMCLTSEDTGQIMSDIWDLWTGIVPFNVWINRIEVGMPGTASPAGQVQHLNDPEALTKEESANRLNIIKTAVEQDNEEYVLYGHTHSAGKYAESVNAGSFTGGNNYYVVVDNGDVELNQYQA